MIRQARESDEADIRRCAVRAYQRYVSVIGREPAPMVADFGDQIREGIVHVATDDGDGRLLGFIVFYAQDGTTLLENVAVDPGAAGRGTGKSLIAFCEAEARRIGHESVCLYTNAKMTDNLAIYPKLGYVEIDRRTEDGFDRVFFEKRLLPVSS